MNDVEERERLYTAGWALGLRGVKLKTYIREHWEPSAAIAGPDEVVEEEAPAVEEEAPAEEPKPKAAKKKKAKKKAAK